VSETNIEKKENPLVNLAVNLIIPTIIMVKFSNDKYLGSVNGLLIALSLPFAYGIFDFIRKRKANFFSIIGLVNIGITGGIGLFELDKNLMIVKETAIPLLFGLVILGSELINKPLIKGFLNNILDLDKIKDAFASIKKEELFILKMKRASYFLAGTFFLSAILNFLLAVYILEGNPGSEEFTASLGKMTFLSFPIIAVPTTTMLGFILYYLFHGLKEADLTLEDVIKQ
jgi:intracellular septation protein A